MLSVAAFLPLLHLFPPPIPPIHLSRFQSNFWLLFRGLGTVAVSSDDRVRVIGDREISAKEDQVVHSEISVLPRVTFLFSLTQYCRLSHLHQPLFSSTLSSYLPPCDLLHFSAPHNHSQCNSYSSTYSQSVIVLFFPGYHSDQQPKQLYFPQDLVNAHTKKCNTSWRLSGHERDRYSWDRPPQTLTNLSQRNSQQRFDWSLF